MKRLKQKIAFVMKATLLKNVPCVKNNTDFAVFSYKDTTFWGINKILNNYFKSGSFQNNIHKVLTFNFMQTKSKKNWN